MKWFFPSTRASMVDSGKARSMDWGENDTNVSSEGDTVMPVMVSSPGTVTQGVSNERV